MLLKAHETKENLCWNNGESFEERECFECENYAIILNGKIALPLFSLFPFVLLFQLWLNKLRSQEAGKELNSNIIKI